MQCEYCRYQSRFTFVVCPHCQSINSFVAPTQAEFDRADADSYGMYSRQMTEWANENQVKPLVDRRSPRYMPPLVPEAITESLKAQATKAFGRALDARLRWEYYDEWRRYDAMVEQMPPHQQALERLGECLELDRIHSLPSP